jgi:hypothetical protein
MKVTAVLSSEYTQRVGGSRVGGFMNTALANQQGELVVPLLVTGTMASPKFAPDVQRIAEMKVKNLVPNLKNPGALTSGILGALGGARSPDGAAGGNTGGSTAGRVGAVLGAITGRKPAATPAPQPAPQDGAAAPKPDAQAPPPPPPSRERQVEDALRGLFGGRKQPEQKPAEPAK